ncbi:MAG: MobC family plasmid mobilization relaxosome protein [Oscillospiraceae bacterium]|nr:MobC family plasmid mobilization relaxosome protein [Oscillospiraceae bacterium]
MPIAKDTVLRKIYFDRKEWEEVCRRAEITGKKPNKFIREMSVFGEVKFYDFSAYKTLVYDLRSIGENINQIARVANTTGSIYEKDIRDIKTELTKLEGVFDNYFTGFTYTPIE